jgi:hypothetical protein
MRADAMRMPGRSLRQAARGRVRRAVRSHAGIGLVEVLAASLILGIAVIGIALMFGKGSAFVAASGSDRVAAGLAQQRIEQIRASGWAPPCAPEQPPAACWLQWIESRDWASGTVNEAGWLKDVVVSDGRSFQRRTCIQHVDPTSATPPFALDDPAWLTSPPYDPDAPTCPDVALATTDPRTLRISVTVESAQPETSRITLQAWMSKAGP